MGLEKIIDGLVFRGFGMARRLPNQWMRFIGATVAFFLMLFTIPVWVPLVLFIGFIEIWRDFNAIQRPEEEIK